MVKCILVHCCLALGSQLGVSREKELLYSAKVNAMNFTSKRQTIVTAKTDNTGEDIITETAFQNIKPGVYFLDEINKPSQCSIVLCKMYDTNNYNQKKSGIFHYSLHKGVWSILLPHIHDTHFVTEQFPSPKSP